MFEAAGARPYPPRSVYLRGLEESQIFVGIYREGYGYIADGMDISGLEDEYRYSSSLGIPQLLYVFGDGEKEPRLRALVDEFTSPGITIAYYQAPSELEHAIRRDLIALVAAYFSRGRFYTVPSVTRPGVVADALVPPARKVRRESVEEELDRLLEVDPVLRMTGPLGSGKTVFLATLSSERNWAFVECGDRPLQEILADAANALRAMLDLPAIVFLLSNDAQAALQAAWEALPSVTLALDDVRTQESLDQVRKAGPVSNSHRLIVSSREDVLTSGRTYRIPPLDLEETREFVRRNRVEPLMAGELVEVHNASKGSPLYLRYYLSGEPGQYAKDVTEYETQVWTSQHPGAREILSYLAWSDRWLSLEELAQLVTGGEGTTEELAVRLDSANSLLVQSERGYSIFHPHAKETIRDLTLLSPPRLQFYVQRLSKWFVETLDYVSAFCARNASGLPVSPNLLEKAGRQAVVKGDVRMAIKILEVQIELVKSSGDKTRERDLTFYLGHLLSLGGRTDAALEMIDRAAGMEADTDPPFDISEVRASVCALGRGDRNAFEQLFSKRDEYRSNQDVWDAARLSVELSVYHLRQHDARRASEEARYAMEAFAECEDDYGFRIARGNYLSAIAALPEHDAETAELIRKIEEEVRQVPRERALLCNVLGRRARDRGETTTAKVLASEAIAIGREIGDPSIVCNNLMNLGNAFRDEENWASAIAQYEAADKLARESKLIMTEGAVQHLLAETFNNIGDGERAVHHANYAISVARGVSATTEADATEELAKAYAQTNKIEDSRDTWLRYAALEVKRTGDSESGSVGFRGAAALMMEHGNVSTYVAAYCKLFNLAAADGDELELYERLIADLPGVFENISLNSTFECAVYHARIMFDDKPEALVRRGYLLAVRELFGEAAVNLAPLKRLRIALALSMSVPENTLTLADLVDVGGEISKGQDNVSFRAGSDGAAHWTVELFFGKQVIVSVSQIDDRPDVSLVTLCLTLALVSFASDIFEDVLSGEATRRDGANVQVCNFGAGEELLPLRELGLVSEPNGCAVTRATVATDTGVPVLVVTSGSVTRNWLPGAGVGTEGQILFAEVLAEIVFQLQEGQIEAETFYPKLLHMVKKTIV